MTFFVKDEYDAQAEKRTVENIDQVFFCCTLMNGDADAFNIILEHALFFLFVQFLHDRFYTKTIKL